KPCWIVAAMAALSIPLVAAAQAPGEGWHRHGGHHGHGGLFASNATIAADRTALEEAFAQLRADAKAGNSAAITADQAAITAAFTKMQSDGAALHAALQSNPAVQSAKSLVEADRQLVTR